MISIQEVFVFVLTIPIIARGIYIAVGINRRGVRQ